MKINFKSQINGYCENDDVWVPKKSIYGLKYLSLLQWTQKNDNKRGDVEGGEVFNESDEAADDKDKSSKAATHRSIKALPKKTSSHPHLSLSILNSPIDLSIFHFGFGSI